MKNLEGSIIERNIQIGKLKEEIDELNRFRVTNELLKKQIRQREEEVGILRAKQYLDYFQISFKLVPEYPDMVEENSSLEGKV